MKKTLSILLLTVSTCAIYAYDVAAIIWPAYQPEPRWKELGIFEHGNGEWQNVYEAKPKFKEHNEPRAPLWGYERDDDPIAMARQIDAALAAGVNVFVYDWYWYQNRPFLENALNNGFLKAPNNERMKFFLMWANHHVDYLWNNKIANKDANPPLYDARVTYEEFTKVLVPRFIEYFKKPNHYKINGKPVFSIYRFGVFMEGLGGKQNPLDKPLMNYGAEMRVAEKGDYAQKTKDAIAYLNDACKKAGFEGVYILVFGAVPEKIVADGKTISTKAEVVKYFGIDATTTYNWNYGTWAKMQSSKPFLTYEKWFEMARALWDKISKENKVPFFPNVTVGWDTNSRYPQLTPLITNSNPKNFEMALRSAKNWLDVNKRADAPQLLFINSWNEWTEGSYLMPDTEFGYGYLNALSRVFGGCGQATE